MLNLITNQGALNNTKNMNKDKHNPNLIILEGPTGVGKTTIQDFLQKTLKSKKIHVDILPEFSKNKFGKLIERNSHYGQEKPDWLMGISGLMLFLADKINRIEMARMDTGKIWICDRFISTEFILGLKMISEKEDNLFAQKTIQQVSEWSLKKISKHSIFVFLDGNVDILQRRLEKRIARKLTQQEFRNLDDEIRGYRQLVNSWKDQNTFVVENNSSVNIVGNKILNWICSKWHL
jgi:thymidylate kinase